MYEGGIGPLTLVVVEPSRQKRSVVARTKDVVDKEPGQGPHRVVAGQGHGRGAGEEMVVPPGRDETPLGSAVV